MHIKNRTPEVQRLHGESLVKFSNLLLVFFFSIVLSSSLYFLSSLLKGHLEQAEILYDSVIFNLPILLMVMIYMTAVYLFAHVTREVGYNLIEESNRK